MSTPISTDRVIIVGAGLGALYAALELAPHPVLVISPEKLGEGTSSAWAQGGVAAAMSDADSAASHSDDTVRAGAGTVDENVAAVVTNAAREHILELTNMGTSFDRDLKGGYVLSREAAHSFARVVRVKGDQSGREIMRALIEQVKKTPSIQIAQSIIATKLETENENVNGLWIESAVRPSKPIMISGTAYLLAGGGSGGLFAITTNPPRIRGQIMGMAARAGAIISDAEFVQFHPTAIDAGIDPAPLATEALRGDGAILINKNGERFMVPIHPDAELAPRDIVARAVFQQTKSGLRPMLDTRSAVGANIVEQYPAVAKACASGGIDPITQSIPVAAAAHYHMGGIDTAINGEASLGNLWVCGEASATGLHGANRLASNGLLEALVFARICSTGIGKRLGKPNVEFPPDVVFRFKSGGISPDPELVAQLRNTMSINVGVVRNALGLMQALRDIAALENLGRKCESFLNMTVTATLIAASALLRKESRGAHFRDDFPEACDTCATRSRITLKQAFALRAKIVKDSS